MMSWKFGMSGITPPRRAALVTRLFQSKISTPGLNNQSSSDSRGDLGTIIFWRKLFNNSMGSWSNRQTAVSSQGALHSPLLPHGMDGRDVLGQGMVVFTCAQGRYLRNARNVRTYELVMIWRKTALGPLHRFLVRVPASGGQGTSVLRHNMEDNCDLTVLSLIQASIHFRRRRWAQRLQHHIINESSSCWF